MPGPPRPPRGLHRHRRPACRAALAWRRAHPRARPRGARRRRARKERLAFSSDPAAAIGCDLLVVCVGTLDAADEWSAAVVREAVRGLASDPSLPRGIVVRSTLLPGTARALAAEARAIDPTVRLAHNPEFTREASAVADFLAPDRVVIGVDDLGADPTRTVLADDVKRVYAPLDAPTVVTDLASAETIKLASNVFLAAKIAFANELARSERRDRRGRGRGRRRHGHGRPHRAQLPLAGARLRRLLLPLAGAGAPRAGPRARRPRSPDGGHLAEQPCPGGMAARWGGARTRPTAGRRSRGAPRPDVQGRHRRPARVAQPAHR